MSKEKPIIRSSKHHFTRFINRGKRDELVNLLKEYRRILQEVVGDLIKTPELPRFYDLKKVGKTWLSQRMLRSLSDQAIWMIRSFRSGKSKKKQICCSQANMSLNSINYDYQPGNKFDEFIRLICLGNHKFIKIPIKYHKCFNKWNKVGQRLSGIEVSDSWVKINFEISPVQLKTQGKVVGADQGYKTILTLSDGQATKEDLIPVIEKLRRKKKGSRAFKRAQAERLNLINRSINQLDLSEIGELRLEKIVGLRHKKRLSKDPRYRPTQEKMLHWTYPLIHKKVEDRCLMDGVRFITQPSFYRSQRCSSCGKVLKWNRRGKVYRCSCGLRIDSDLNAAKNHEMNLPPVLPSILGSGLNKTGFYWLESGFFNLDGGSLQSPFTKNIPKLIGENHGQSIYG